MPKNPKTTTKKTKSAKPKKVKKAAVKKLKTVKKSAPKDITEIVTDYKSACKHLKRKAVLPDVSMLPEKHRKAFIAFIVLTTIIEAWNEGWEADFLNSEYKYFVWAWLKKDDKHESGFGFSLSYYDLTFTYSTVGSRLSYKNSSLALRGAKILETHYLDLWLIPKSKKVVLKVKAAK